MQMKLDKNPAKIRVCSSMVKMENGVAFIECKLIDDTMDKSDFRECRIAPCAMESGVDNVTV